MPANRLKTCFWRIASLAAFGLLTLEGKATLDFQGLSQASPLPKGYAGLNWQGFNSLGSTSIDHAGDAAGNMYAYFNLGPSYTSSPFVARIYADPSEVFDFSSGMFSGQWRGNLAVQIQGWRDGTLLDQTTITLARRSFGTFTFGFQAVDEVRFLVYWPQSALTGTGNPYYWQQQYAFAMDNLAISGPVPVPEPSSLLAAALALFPLGFQAFHALRKNRVSP